MRIGQTAQITHSFHPINWWSDCVGQIVTILDVYETTGYVKIRVVKKTSIVAYDHPYGGIGLREGTAEEIADIYYDPHYQAEGWIDPQYLKMIGGERRCREVEEANGMS